MGGASTTTADSRSLRTHHPGLPDLLMVRRGRLLAIELKVGDRTPTKAQDAWLVDLDAVPGVEAGWWNEAYWHNGNHRGGAPMNVEVKVNRLGGLGAVNVTVADLDRRQAHSFMWAPAKARTDGMPCMNPMEPAPLPSGPPQWRDHGGYWVITCLGPPVDQVAYVGGGA